MSLEKGWPPRERLHHLERRGTHLLPEVGYARRPVSSCPVGTEIISTRRSLWESRPGLGPQGKTKAWLRGTVSSGPARASVSRKTVYCPQGLFYSVSIQTVSKQLIKCFQKQHFDRCTAFNHIRSNILETVPRNYAQLRAKGTLLHNLPDGRKAPVLQGRAGSGAVSPVVLWTASPEWSQEYTVTRGISRTRCSLCK